MDSNKQAEFTPQWAVVELMGHAQIAGKVSEQTIGGSSFIRVDVPAVGDNAAFTRTLSNSAIYAFNWTTEEIATAVAARSQVVPIQPYQLQLPKHPAIPSASGIHLDDDYDDDDSRRYKPF